MQSDKVPYYILDLLQQVPSVYVQGLGRFDAIFHPAVIDIHHSQIKPPYLEPGFVVEEQEAGDLLTTYMHYVSGMDKEEALESIRAFVEQVNLHINAGEPYQIDKFGTFSKSAADILHFTPDWDAFNLSFNGLEVIDIHPPQVHPAPATETQSFEPVPEAAPAISETIYEPTLETNWVTDRESPEPERQVDLTPAATSPFISDSTSRLWWIILVSALIMISFLCAYLVWDILSNKEKINQYTAITNDTLANSSPDVIIVDTLEFMEEEIPVVEPVEIEPIPEPPVSEDPETPCFVVVGAFSDPANVIKMESRLKGLGYRTEQIKGGSLTRVAIRTKCDKDSLQKTLNDARSSINPEAWIY